MKVNKNEGEAKRQEPEALGTFGMLSGADPTIAPLRRALAVRGLTTDDVGVASVRFDFFSKSFLLQLLTCLFLSSMGLLLLPTTRMNPTLTMSNSDILVELLETLVQLFLKNT